MKTEIKTLAKERPALSVLIVFFLVIILMIFFGSILSNNSPPINSPPTQLNIKQTGSCSPTWQCSTWEKCSANRTQGRTCILDKLKNCTNTDDKPKENRPCEWGREEYKKYARSVLYDNLFRFNEEFIGESIYLHGEITQIIQVDKNNWILKANTGRIYDAYFFDDEVIIYFQSSERLLEGDVVDIWGEVLGLRTYTTVLGAERTAPLIDAKFITYYK
ncbi:hypothetical protein HYT55_01300 [Candidatus Woesearchaeota archaeon]|nr:hypothetical protein [Candidatus Woesearchaeota archaeon]